MAEEVKQEKKKVYVETTVVSDATALPMKVIVQQEDTLEEMWRIKREIAKEYPTWEEYIAGIYAFQEEERRRGVKFANIEPVKPSFATA